ncbi:hypothetical protein KI688_006599 [Linnemannia hyalina]|uniref:Uncharacterized protein n=1 Tax=Linnemannia hyalina TaxID=64524 RepID=A0A9P7XJY1_9FUNG|nr:hypothetical protein KI688_006599 [Linnemannia hyalina]
MQDISALRYVTSRPILQQYLQERFGEDLDIADDLHKVGKKYGSYRNNVEKEEAMTLLANYSFNDRPIYFLEVEMDENSIKDITVTKYKRPDECTAITLVAGAHKGITMWT